MKKVQPFSTAGKLNFIAPGHTGAFNLGKPMVKPNPDQKAGYFLAVGG